ncbi:E3 ubiquitin-protein ligase TRIM41-like [Tyto alba]|uniref:E3 ubiquitin-protein ligase TRIM41-like n=1 Tax=Tyto alba TaxID=56313 RepID=UPI0014022F92|nr:E3 ubiquitin-protein ligase TRIM41-like [Tyto alba]
MAELGAVAGLKEELTCPICLNIYSNPVSLSCGHSFCQVCVQEAHSRRQCPQGPFSCPLCQAQADGATELQPNVQLRSIVQKFLDAPAPQEEEERDVQCQGKGESSGQQNKAILCDFCLEEPQPAAKTCLSCEASLCQAHLRKHNAKSPLKDHVLMEPCSAQFLAERRCPLHGKLLECYCETDTACVCMLCCVMSSHKDHKITTLEEAFGQAKSVFSETLEMVKTQEAALNESIANLLKQEEEVKTKEHLQKNQLLSLFKEMHLQLDKKKGEFMKALSHNEDQQLSRIQAEIKKHKEGKDAASHDIKELETLGDQKDLLLFVKAFAAIRTREHKLVPNKDGVKLPVTPVILDEFTRDATLRFFQKFLSDMQCLFKALPVHEHLTFSMRRGTGIIYCGKEIHSSSLKSFQVRVPKTPGAIPYVASDQSFSEGCHFWEVDTSNAKCWRLGIISYRSECYLQMSHNYLHVFQGQTMIKGKEFPTGLKVVRVELDCGRNTLSFYNMSVKDGDPAENLSLIETVSITVTNSAHATFGMSDGSLKLL